MMSFALLTLFICTLNFVDAATIDEHVTDIFERQSTEEHEKICEKYDINNDTLIDAKEIWVSEEYGDPTKSIRNVQFWVRGFGTDGSMTQNQCLDYLTTTTNASNPDRERLCKLVDMDGNEKISADEILATPDDLFTLVFTFNPHFVETAEADFAITLYDNEIMEGNDNGEMDMDECKHFLSPPHSPSEIPSGLCKVIAGEDDLITPDELHDHFVIMEHKDVELELAQFVIETFDTDEKDKKLNQKECINFFMRNFPTQ